MRDSFWDMVWASFKAVYGPVLVIVPIAASLIFFVLASVGLWWKIALSLATLLCMLTLILLFTLFDSARKGYKKYEEALRNPLPRILYSRPSYPSESAELVCLLEPSALFSHDIWVSFHDEIEELKC